MSTDAHTALTTNPLGTNVAALAGYVFGTAPYTKAAQVFNDINTNLNTGLSTDKTNPKQVVCSCLYMYIVALQLIRTGHLL